MEDEVTQQTQHTAFRHVRGNIVHIAMTNFLTFSDTVVKPCPKLNLIIGPNGTGKSSIVNAICIVLAGKLSLLGRGGDLASFVRHGSDRAVVEIWLHEPSNRSGVVKVRREFNTQGSSLFFIDERKAAAKDVVALTRDFDIQLDNLSQFMPQEKISDFVGIKPDDMLKITVRSLGGTGRVEKLEELRSADAQMRKLDGASSKHRDELQEMKARNEDIRADVEAYQQQRELKRQLRLAERVLPHRQAEELHSELLRHVDLRKEAETVFKNLREEMRKAETSTLKQLDFRQRTAKQEFDIAKERLRSSYSDHSQPTRVLDELEQNARCKRVELLNIDRVAKRNEDKLEQARSRLETLERELRTIKEQSALDKNKNDTCFDRLQRLNDEKEHHESEKFALERKMEDANRAMKSISNRLNRLTDHRLRKIELIDKDNRWRGTSGFLHVLHRLVGEKRLRGRVYGPIGAEVSCRSRYHSRIMESCVSGWLVGAFVTEDDDDSRLFINECKRELGGLAPNTISTPTDTQGRPALRHQVPERRVDSALHDLGIECMVPDIFTAPDHVRAALNAQVNLHKIFVGNDHAERNLDALKAERGVQVWYTPLTRVQVIRSRYDPSQTSLRMDTKFRKTDGSMYMGSSEQVELEKRRLQDEYREEEHAMDKIRLDYEQQKECMRQFEVSRSKMKEEIAVINKKQQYRRDLERQCSRIESDVRLLESKQCSDANEEKKKALREQIVNYEKRIVMESQVLFDTLNELQSSVMALDAKLVDRIFADREYEAEKEKSGTLKTELVAAEELFESRKIEVKRIKADWNRKRDEALEAIGEEEIVKEKATVSEWFQKEAVWLQNHVEKLQDSIQTLSRGGINVLRDYEDRLRRIEDLEKRIAQDENRIDAQRRQFAIDKNEFLEWLRDGVNRVKVKFSNLFARFGCAGDLELTGGTDSMDDLLLQILVSYRNGASLRPISASANSGGEKMCCTMLFCFSLLHDEARIPPFVIVDELNQGLDISNEMKIMRIMFEDAGVASTPQCFVVTPKLIPGLPFNRNIATHVIFNGNVVR